LKTVSETRQLTLLPAMGNKGSCRDCFPVLLTPCRTPSRRPHCGQGQRGFTGRRGVKCQPSGTAVSCSEQNPTQIERPSRGGCLFLLHLFQKEKKIKKHQTSRECSTILRAFLEVTGWLDCFKLLPPSLHVLDFLCPIYNRVSPFSPVSILVFFGCWFFFSLVICSILGNFGT